MYTRIVNILQIIRGFSLLGKKVTNKESGETNELYGVRLESEI